MYGFNNLDKNESKTEFHIKSVRITSFQIEGVNATTQTATARKIENKDSEGCRIALKSLRTVESKAQILDG